MTMRQLPTQSALEASQPSLPPPPRPKVFIDTDIGDDIDDALALAIALNSPEIDLQGISTVFGNTRLRAYLATHILHTFGHPDVPVAAGCALPIQHSHQPSGVPQAAILPRRQPCPDCTDLLQSTGLSGPELLIQTALCSHGQLTILCLGPLTNLAEAIKLEPRLFMAVKRLIIMGGSSSLPLPDWNIRSDATAARIVLGAGIPVTLLGMNITLRCQLSKEDLKLLEAAVSPQVRLLHQLLAIWQRHRPRSAPSRPYLHDPLTLAALCQPDLFTFEDITARVITHGPLKGFMFPRLLSGPIVTAATNIQADAARQWCVRRLLASEKVQLS